MLGETKGMAPAPLSSGTPTGPHPGPWWDRRISIGVVLLLAVLPLVGPAIPPLTDVMGHMARYRVALAAEGSPLREYYGYHWAAVGNLGVDGPVVLLAPLIGLEPAVKLVVLLIPLLTVAGMIALARQAHGRIPATAFFALPFAWAFPFHFGFVNFCLGMALALIGLTAWRRLGAAGRPGLRAAFALVLAPLLWLAHSFAWGCFGLMALAAELARSRDEGRGWPASCRRAALAVLPLAPPALLMLHGPGTGAGRVLFTAWYKLGYLLFALKGTEPSLDLLGVAAALAIVAAGLLSPRFAIERQLAWPAAALGLAFLLLPTELMQGSYIDMRILPYALALGVLAIRPSGLDPRRLTTVAALGLALFAARQAVTAVQFAATDRRWAEQLQALDHLPRGARVFAIVALDCYTEWRGSRMDHLAAMAVTRREAFVNGLWAYPGLHLLSVKLAAPWLYVRDGSQIVRPGRCRNPDRGWYPEALATLPPAFTHLWLIDVPPASLPHDPGLRPLWRGRTGGLYRIEGPVRRLPRIIAPS
jgi:hypothetical protein